MINELIFANEKIINSLGWTLLHSIWQISVIAILLAAFLRMNKFSAAIKYNVSVLGILLVPVLAIITFYYYNQNISADIAEEGTGILHTFKGFHLDSTYNISIIDQISTAVNNYSLLLVILWFSGVFILLIRFTGGLYLTGKLRNTGLIKIENNLIELVEKFRHSCGISRKIKIFESVLIKVPVTIGYLKPLILLPAGTLSGIPSAQIEAIIAHEIAHIKRLDYLQNLVTTLIEIIFFYHPAIWWISDRINEERENSCDDIAIGLTGNSTELARALAGINKTFTHPQHILAMTGKQNYLLDRIKRLAGITENSRKLTYHSFGFILIAVIAASIAFSVNASVQIPDSLMKTSISMAANNPLPEYNSEIVVQDTLKTKNKSKKTTENPKSVKEKKEKPELSEAEKARLKDEMEKLGMEMKKLEEQMKDLHKQLGFTEWSDFDFKYDFNMDSINIIINKAMIDSREIIEKAHQNADVARARAMKKVEVARSEARNANKEIIIINGDNKKIIRGNGGDNEKMKAKLLKIKAESNHLEEELRKDGLIQGNHFNLKIDNTGMYLDDKKQSEDVFQKYIKIIMSDFEGEDEKWIEDKKFNINITK